ASAVCRESEQEKWCERGDSNPHGFTRQILSLVRLPIPPLSHNHLPIVTDSSFSGVAKTVAGGVSFGTASSLAAVPLPRFSGTHLSCSRPAGPSPAPGAFTVVRSSQ